MSDNETNLKDIYEDNFSKVYNFFFYHVLHREISEDLTEQTFLKVAEHLNQYDPKKAKPGTWVMKIAQNTLIDYYRIKKNMVSIDADDTGEIMNHMSVSFEEQYEQIVSPKRKELYLALSKLSELERELIYQKYFLDKSYHDMEKQFGRGSSTLATIVQRAKEKLKSSCE